MINYWWVWILLEIRFIGFFHCRFKIFFIYFYFFILLFYFSFGYLHPSILPIMSINALLNVNNKADHYRVGNGGNGDGPDEHKSDVNSWWKILQIQHTILGQLMDLITRCAILWLLHHYFFQFRPHKKKEVGKRKRSSFSYTPNFLHAHLSFPTTSNAHSSK